MDRRHPLGPIGNARRLQHPHHPPPFVSEAPTGLHQIPTPEQIRARPGDAEQHEEGHDTTLEDGHQDGQDEPGLVLSPGWDSNTVPAPHHHLDRGRPLPPGQGFNDPHYTDHPSNDLNHPGAPADGSGGNVTSTDAILTQAALIHRLPTELVDQTLDHAGYFPSKIIGVRSTEDSIGASGSKVYLTAHIPDFEAMDKDTLGKGGKEGGRPNRVRKLVFRITSRDQGWSSDTGNKGTYKGCHSWIDAELWRKKPEGDVMKEEKPGEVMNEPEEPETEEKPEKEIKSENSSVAGLERHMADAHIVPRPDNPTLHLTSEPKPAPRPSKTSETHPEEIPDADGLIRIGPPHIIQRNHHGDPHYVDHTIVWDWSAPNPPSEDDDTLTTTGHTEDPGFVKMLRGGDEVRVVMRCMYPGWSCRVGRAEVECFWAI